MGSRNLVLEVMLAASWGGLIFLLFFRDVFKGRRAFRRVLAFVAGLGALALIAGTYGLTALLLKVAEEASPVIEGAVVLVNGSPIPCVFLFVASAGVMLVGLFVLAVRLVYSGITGRHQRSRRKDYSLPSE